MPVRQWCDKRIDGINVIYPTQDTRSWVGDL
nr:MAG TPA: hypothetical protein [Caudoviricetes sp.]